MVLPGLLHLHHGFTAIKHRLPSPGMPLGPDQPMIVRGARVVYVGDAPALGALVVGGKCEPSFLDNWWWMLPGAFVGWSLASYLEDAATAHRRFRTRGRG